MSNEVTQWFYTPEKPARKGVYQRRYFDMNIKFGYFDGRVWYVGAETAIGAYARYRERVVSLSQNAPWRGLAQKPV